MSCRPISRLSCSRKMACSGSGPSLTRAKRTPTSSTPANRRLPHRSEEHTSELQSLMRISYAVFCLKKKQKQHIKKQDKTENIHLIKSPLQKKTIYITREK